MSAPHPPTRPPLTALPDVALILRIIHGLAAYEKEEPSIVEATEESLARTLGFLPGHPAYAKVILAFTAAGEAAGMALYFYNYSTWRGAPGIYLEDLFVFDEFRGRGVGTALLAALAREVQAIGGKRVEWSVLKCGWHPPRRRACACTRADTPRRERAEHPLLREHRRNQHGRRVAGDARDGRGARHAGDERPGHRVAGVSRVSRPELIPAHGMAVGDAMYIHMYSRLSKVSVPSSHPRWKEQATTRRPRRSRCQFSLDCGMTRVTRRPCTGAT